MRRSSLTLLVALDAPRLSPLVAYQVATRLTDPVAALRAKVVETLGDVLGPDEQGHPAPEPVRAHLVAFLTQMRIRSIYAVLQVAAAHPQLETQVARVFNACPYAGKHLADILAERKFPLEIRQQAVHFIGLVGYLDALPALQRLAKRLEARQDGQQRMPFAPPSAAADAALLPEIKETLRIFKSP